jgi:hypothetical protein
MISRRPSLFYGANYLHKWYDHFANTHQANIVRLLLGRLKNKIIHVR